MLLLIDPMGALIFGNDLKERVPAYALRVEKRGVGGGREDDNNSSDH